MEIPGLHPFVLRQIAAGLRPNGEDLRAYQDRQLRALVRHAAAAVPLYRRLYREAGIDASRFRGLDDLDKLPFVTRAHLQQTPMQELVADGIRTGSLVTHRSSGSMGIPIAVLRTREEDLFLQGIRLRALMTSGLRAWERRARVIYVGRDHPPDGHSRANRGGRQGLFPFRNFSGFAHPEENAEAIASYRPSAITGHPGFIERICFGAPGETLERIRPRMVACAGECLTKPVRRLIEQTLNTKVCDFYAAHEFNLIAWQQEPGGPMAVSTMTVLAEVVPWKSRIGEDAGATHEQVGELVGTALWSFAAPIIRYRLGDEVVSEETDAVTGFASSLREVRGRSTDRFVTRRGAIRHAYEVVEPLLAEPFWFGAYRLEQNAPGRIHARFVPLPGVGGDMRELRLRCYCEQLAPEFELQAEWVDALPPEENGKRRLFVRSIPLPGEHDLPVRY